MKLTYPDYDHSILNLINSVLNHFGAKYTHTTLPKLDCILNKNYKNVVVMVFDAMGSKNIESILPEDSFLRKHMIDEITSVYPPTTTAATMTLESGLAPMEHSWLGWSLHFDEVNDNVNIFINTNDKGENVADYHVARRYIPYKNVIDKIKDTGNSKAYSVSPFGTYPINDIYELMSSVEMLCNKQEKHYIYTYWPEPDSSMHTKGISSEDSIYWIKKINNMLEELSGKLKDTLLIITADHGHIDGRNELIVNYKEITSCLKWPPSIEPRSLAFHVKEGMKQKFKDVFLKEFGDDFLLLSREEVLKKKLFGYGEEHTRFQDFLGDYLAIAIAETSIFNNEAAYKKFIGVHAGLTEWEMMVPLIVVECK
ncbi:alkaline phosphatase family protein [Clostridium sp.]|uniref:alkaline phosphatase family protein n=1 Tax=Clostridium sp. TaxID=1506 RepID=UPI003217C383